MPEPSHTITVIGAGTIGVTWSALFAVIGHAVKLHDVREDFEAAARDPNRAIVGHPFNPPHLVPLVEVCGTGDVDNGLIARVRDQRQAAVLDVQKAHPLPKMA